MAKDSKNKNYSPVIENRKARHDYHILDTLECGIVLDGSEVKSVREGKVSLAEGYARVDERTGELLLHGVHIADYAPARGYYNAPAPTRTRKLLAHAREIRKLAQQTEARGVTLVPLKLYFKNGFAKVLIGVGEGKKQYDKREAKKEQEARRDIERAMTRKRL